MKARVYVRLKTGVLDPQGRAIAEALHGLGYHEVADARVGKVIDLDLTETDPTKAHARATDIAAKLLVNPVIESFEIEVLG